MFSFFLARLTSVFILIAVFLPRSAPRPGPGRCCPPPAAAGNGGRSGPAPGRACRPYIRPLCKRLARSAPPRPPRERRFPCCTIGLRMERPAQPSNPVPGGTQEGRGARGEGAPALALHEESPALPKGICRQAEGRTCSPGARRCSRLACRQEMTGSTGMAPACPAPAALPQE